MKYSEQAKRCFRYLDTVIFLCISFAVTLFGVFGIYFFLILPLKSGLPLYPPEVVLGFGILAIGVFALVGVFYRTKSFFWLNMANVSLWFFFYDICFEVLRFNKGQSSDMQNISAAIFTLASTVLFVILSIRSRKNRK